MSRYFLIAFGVLVLAGCAPWSPASGTLSVANMNFTAEIPPLWKRLNTARNPVVLTKDGVSLDVIFLGRSLADTAFVHTRKRVSRDMLAQEIAEVAEDDLRSTPGYNQLEVLENAPLTIDGHPGFAVTVRYRTADGLRMREKWEGFLTNGWMYLLKFRATERVYFDKELSSFRKITASFRTLYD